MTDERRPPVSGSGSLWRPAAPPTTFGRRRLLPGGVGGLGVFAGAALLGACSEVKDSTDQVSPGPDETLTALFPRDIAYLAAGVPSRLVYTITDAEGVPAMTIAEPLEFTFELDGEAIGSPTVVAPHSDGVPRPYLPLDLTFPKPGLYDINATRGDVRLNSQVMVSEASKVQNPLIGSVLPPASTPTLTASFDVDPICTRVPTCPFHDEDLTTVLGTGRPVVVLLASPAYCRTSACGPILDVLIEEAAALPDNVVVIHSEVYKNPKDVSDLNDATLAPLPETYRMGFEPSLFVTDASNLLVARGDIVVDRGEMAQMLALAK
ncbi:hypothetical protein BH10ACT3_BH10ACT3_17270 [soil metagenome]